MKYILVALILVLAGVLWLLLPEREGLENPLPYTDQGCWKDQGNRALNGGPQQYGYTVQRCYEYAKNAGSDTFALQDNGWCVTNKTGDDYKKYGKAEGACPPLGGAWVNHVYTVNPPAPPPPPAPAASCPTNGEGISSVKQSGGQNIRLYTSAECSALRGNFIGNGQRDWGMKTNDVGECYGIPGINISFCNQTAPPSTNAATAAGVAPAAPPPPPPPAPAPAPPPPSPPPPPPPPAPAISSTDSQMGTLISLLQQDITSRRSSLLNTANNPNVPVGSLLTQSTMNPNWQPAVNGTIPGPSAESMAMGRGPYDEIPKSSLVPCTCPTYSMNCPIHVGSQPSSQVPGDVASALSKAQDQYDLMRPFTNTDRDVPGFLNTFSAFG